MIVSGRDQISADGESEAVEKASAGNGSLTTDSSEESEGDDQYDSGDLGANDRDGKDGALDSVLSLRMGDRRYRMLHATAKSGNAGRLRRAGRFQLRPYGTGPPPTCVLPTEMSHRKYLRAQPLRFWA